MIIIKIIILYFLQITDDFPPTGTRLVLVVADNTSHTLIDVRRF